MQDSVSHPKPNRLFHFCSLGTDERKEWLREILVKNQVYFRSRKQLNDPNDLRPSVVFDGTEEELREFVRNRVIAQYPFSLSPAKRLIEEKRLIHTYRDPRRFERIYHDILGSIGVFCASKTSTNELLWAHYADGHRGVVIEFNSNIGLFSSAQEVRYTNKDSDLVINALSDNSKDTISKSMLTKSNSWSYEEEWRIISRKHDKNRKEMYLRTHKVSMDEAEFIRVMDGPGYYSIPSEAICSVILGSSISDDNKIWLSSLISTLSKPPVLRQASLGRNGRVTIS